MNANFRNPKIQLLMTCILIVLLLGPVVLGELNLLDYANTFAASRIMESKFLVGQLRNGPPEIDMAFIGSSELASSMSANIIQKQLSEKFNKPSVVMNFSSIFGDTSYALSTTEALLKSKKIKMLVVELQTQELGEYESLSFNWWQAWSHRDLMSQLTIKDQLRLYSEAVMAVPLQILGLIHSPDALGISAELLSKYEKRVKALGSEESRTGYSDTNWIDPSEGESKYVEKDFVVETFKPEDLIYRGPENLVKKHFVQNWNLNEKQILFYTRIKELTEKQGGKLVFIKVNKPGDNTSTSDLPRNIPTGLQTVPIVVIPETWLTGKYDTATKRLALYNYSHRNFNGMKLFTETISPALLQIYNEYYEKH